ncbi:MAG: HD domain-containing protein [Thermoplasmata archaeon]
MKVLRDPIHGYIELLDHEISLIDTRPLQRLRGIKQLARADLVYPSLVHTRFEHSLGVMHVASEMGKRLGLDDDQLKRLRIAALLHDIGHGPYSHVFDNVLRRGSHEEITHKIIKENEEVREALAGCGTEPDEILDIFDDRTSISHELLSSPLDADRIDYLLRDAYHAGVAYGLFDYHRLVWTLERYHDGYKDNLCTSAKGRDALLSFVLARYFMHLQVYQHHVRAITDNMLVRGITLGKECGVFPESLFDTSSKDFLDIFLEYNDEKIAREGISGGSGPVREIFECIGQRKLFKRAYDRAPREIEEAGRRRRLVEWFRERPRELEEMISKKAGVSPESIICYLMRIDNPLSPDGAVGEPLVKAGERVMELHEVVDFRPIETAQQRLYVFCPSALRDDVRRAAEEVLAAL